MNDCYITRRIIDACLRENVFGILNRASTRTAPPAPLDIPADVWLQIQSRECELCLPVRPTRYMQRWLAAGDTWLERQNGGGWITRQGYAQWLDFLAREEDQETQAALRDYCLEASTAALHRKLCREAFVTHGRTLNRAVCDIPGWQHRMMFSEQIAAFHDHPYYPTARAKSGFDDEALRRYAPEFAPAFKLRWLAVEKRLLCQTSPPPACWPEVVEVGLPEDFSVSHQLIPVHPLTWNSLDVLPQGVIKTTTPALIVRPTLSVRTLMVESMPEIHIKVPLAMRTLGNKNVRLIKPGTLYDGHRFSRLLSVLERHDAFLKNKYCHCDEQHGAHFGDDTRLGYIVRRYPKAVCRGENSLVPVAAFASQMPDGRLYLQHLVDIYYGGDLDAWLNAYLDLMLGVHLRLWLVYGIALEANQQNAVVVFSRSQPLTLLMKDNDAARLWPTRFCEAMPTLAEELPAFIDRRILVESELPLAQMFTTITLQLNIAAVFEAIAEKPLRSREQLYRSLRLGVERILNELEAQGAAVQFARQVLLESEYLYAKYLLSAGSLMTKQRSGAKDINKYYGLSAPNFLREY